MNLVSVKYTNETEFIAESFIVKIKSRCGTFPSSAIAHIVSPLP